MGKVDVTCSSCGKTKHISKDSLRRNSGLCLSCSLKKNWQNKKWRSKQLEIRRNKNWRNKISASINKFYNKNGTNHISEMVRNAHKNGTYVDHMRKINKDPTIMSKRIESFQETLATTDLSKRMSERSKKLWTDPEFRKKVHDGMMKDATRKIMAEARMKQPRKSSLEDTTARMLTDMKVEFKRNVRTGPYEFDFLIQRPGQKPLLLELHGDYWHRKVEHVMENDKLKAEYWKRHLSDQYDLKYLWEHEFLCFNRASSLLKQWTSSLPIDFDFKDVSIQRIENDRARSFIKAYHYLDYKAGINVAAILNDQVIAIAVFSRPTRFESATCEGYQYKETMELSRFCISPSHHKKNFASWFLSRTTNELFKDESIKAIISFADLTIGHNGSIYLANNWKFIHIVPPDYWYVDDDGHFMHKRTLYGHAVRMRLKEMEFAENYGYHKIKGQGKLKFIKTPR